MTTHENVLSWWSDTTGTPGAQIRVNAEGALAGVLIGEAEHLVERFAVRRVGDEPYRPSQVRVEVDEIETIGTCAGIQVRLRHSFDRVWQVRIGLTNTGDRAVRLGRLVLDVAAGTDGWLEVFAAGAVAQLTFHRLATTSCLALRLTRGDLIIGPAGLSTPELDLAPGGHYQLVLSGEWYPDPATVRHRLPAWFPAALDHSAADRADALITHPDVAVTEWSRGDAPDQVMFDVADPRGVTRLIASYVEEDLSYGRVARAIAAHGVVDSAAQGLVVLRGTIAHHLAHDEAAGLVEAYLDRPPDAPSPLRVLLLLRAREVFGVESYLERAVVECSHLPGGPGAPLAVLHLLTTAVTTAEPVAGEEILAGLAGWSTAPDLDAVTQAELQILFDDPRHQAKALREVDLLCTTGPGELWPARADADIARALVVRSLLPVPESSAPGQRVRRLIARAEAAPGGMEALAWLSIRA